MREDEEHIIEYKVNADFTQFLIVPELLQTYVKTTMGNHGKENGKGTGHSPNYYFGRIGSGLLFAAQQSGTQQQSLKKK